MITLKINGNVIHELRHNIKHFSKLVNFDSWRLETYFNDDPMQIFFNSTHLFLRESNRKINILWLLLCLLYRWDQVVPDENNNQLLTQLNGKIAHFFSCLPLSHTHIDLCSSKSIKVLQISNFAGWNLGALDQLIRYISVLLSEKTFSIFAKIYFKKPMLLQCVIKRRVGSLSVTIRRVSRMMS